MGCTYIKRPLGVILHLSLHGATETLGHRQVGKMQHHRFDWSTSACVFYMHAGSICGSLVGYADLGCVRLAMLVSACGQVLT